MNGVHKMTEDFKDSFIKPTFKPKFFSEYSMGALDFNRFDYWIREADKWGAIIDSKDIPDLYEVQQYFAAINCLFRNWKAIIALKQIQEEYMIKIGEARSMKRIWEDNYKIGNPMNKKFILKLTDLLGEIHTKLMETKQIIGLGIAVKRSMSIQERIKRGVRGHKDDFDDLPEA